MNHFAIRSIKLNTCILIKLNNLEEILKARDMLEKHNEEYGLDLKIVAKFIYDLDNIAGALPKPNC